MIEFLLLICVLLAIWVGRRFTVREEEWDAPQHDWGDADVRNDNFYHKKERR